MRIDTIEATGFNAENLDLSNLKKINKSFETNLEPVDGSFQKIDVAVDNNLKRILEIDSLLEVTSLHPTIMDATKEMLYGIERNGFKTMGLNDLSKWKLDSTSEYYYQNLRQQSGYAAEILSTYKENLLAKLNGSELITYRADDLPDKFPRNDQYVDKVRINSNGEIIERIQTKFIGKDGKEWLTKMMSKKFEKYLDGEHVDKLECPKDYYDDIKASILERRDGLFKQLERNVTDGKTDVVEKIQYKINKLNRIDEMLEQSNTTSGEAMFARLHPKSVAVKIFATETTKLSNNEGLKSGAFAAGITFVVSTVDNVSAYLDGEISADKIVKEIVKETGAAGILGYGTQFISTAVSQTMRASSSQLIRSVGGSCLPASVVSFVVESYDSISEFAQGEIAGNELAYDLGENATAIAAGIKGAAVGTSVGTKIGALVGMVAGPVGTAVGATVGGVTGSLIGGVVGCAVLSEVYATAMEYGADHVEQIADKVKEFANKTVELAGKEIPDKVDSIKLALNEYANENHIAFKV